MRFFLLNSDCDWKKLKEFMDEGTGTVEYANVMSGADGRSRGFGTVRYATVADAEYAIENINGSDMGGRELIVREDNGGKGAGEGGGRGRGGGRGGGFRDSPFGGKGGKGGKGKGKGKGGKGKGGGRPPKSKEGLDDDLDSYFGSKDAPEGVKSKKEEASKGGLDDDLDSYFAAKSAPAEPAAE